MRIAVFSDVHGNVAALEAVGCCGGGVPSPMLELGRPRSSPENYEVRDVGGVTVYLARELASRPGSLEVGLSKLFAWKTLTLVTSDEKEARSS